MSKLPSQTIRMNWYKARMRSILVSVSLCLVPAGCKSQGSKPREVFRVEVTPKRALYDHPLTVVVRGAEPNETVTLSAYATDRFGQKWSSVAVFQAGPNGHVDLASNAPVSGSYDVADPMGLVWSMVPSAVEDTSQAMFICPSDRVSEVTFQATSGDLTASATVERCSPLAGWVRKVKVREDGLVGELYLPVDTAGKPWPGVVMLGGSEGGIPRSHAALIASHGYAVLALGYFGTDSLPNELIEIPLEYFVKGIDWLAARPQVRPAGIALHGGSRGAEAALLVAARWPEKVAAVVACAPSSLVFQGQYAKMSDYRRGVRSAWAHQGKPVPFADASPGMMTILQLMAGQPVAFRKSFAGPVADPKKHRDSGIAVERIACPILLIAGKDDQVWPSSQMAGQIIIRRRRAGVASSDVLCCYEGAGHYIPPPFIPTPATRFRYVLLGGDAKANAIASRDAHRKTLDFLARHLMSD